VAVLGTFSLLAVSMLRGDHEVGAPAHILIKPDALKWGPPPPGLPAGAQLAVLVGDPGKAEMFVFRAKMPDGYTVKPHWHSIDESVTVLQGTMLLGSGDTLDASKAEAMPAGSFMQMPKMMHHYAIAKGETIIQIHGMGPFDITYINPADDPRKADEKK
jgi:hypothetical protein